MKPKLIKIAELSLIVLFIVLTIWFINRVGIEQVRVNVDQFGIWAPLIVLLLRLTSIVVPALPGTAYSILAGTLFGFVEGLVVIAIADFIACTANFWIAKRYGRGIVQKLVGQRFMGRVDRLSRRYLEGNFFLLTGVLMTGVFDFVCYAVGLTRMSWRSFTGALSLSIVIAKPPIVAIGAGLFERGRILLGIALLGTFALAILTGWLKRNQNLEERSDGE
ncbi:MAG: TVP38/TMEM64 family protein [Cyanobacteria bacterium CRU_2_1]|nr:TVP38/TMEM64 family protein [Cyanobacteria bacterium RU_5_0]NJR63385.1 TVP38/TMEM64 family protein [Cyanobacteria bacterium CRU_2_1]